MTHKLSVDTQKAEESEEVPIIKGFQIADEITLKRMDKLFRTAYYLVKKVCICIIIIKCRDILEYKENFEAVLEAMFFILIIKTCF